MSDVYVCKESGAFEYGGDMVVVNKGVTRVRKGHPILDLYPELFEEITVHYDVERATAEPGEKRSVQLPEPKPTDLTPDPPVDDVEALRAEAEKAGVRVDKRWGADKLRAEIAAAGKGKE
jgi:hypothetical protein